VGKYKVFLDANIWFSAAMSEQGGSFLICRLAQTGLIKGFANNHVLEEAERNLLLKAPQKLEAYFRLLKNTKPETVNLAPDLKFVRRLDYLLPAKDIPVVFGALATKADFLIVWNEFMREKVIELQGYSPDEIIVTGVPQFDFYARTEGLLSREEFCRRHGLDPKKKIVLYGSAGAELFDESQYVSLIKKFMEEEKLAEANILVRPHLGYKGDVDRFLVFEGRDGIVVDKTDKQNHTLRDHFDTSTNHVHNLYNSLYYADVCVNVASTLSLDAIACGTEVINFNFDIDPDINPRASVKRLFISDYVRELMATGGTHFARSKVEFLNILKDVLERRKQKNTQDAINRFIYKTDGKSAERITKALIKILSAKS